MSLPDTIFIFGLALVIFGPKKLPEMGRQMGKLLYEFRRASNEFKAQIEEELRAAEEAERRNRSAIESGLQDGSIPAATVTSVDGSGALDDGSSAADVSASTENSAESSYGAGSSTEDEITDTQEDWEWDSYENQHNRELEAETGSSQNDSTVDETVAGELGDPEGESSAGDESWYKGRYSEPYNGQRRDWDHDSHDEEQPEGSSEVTNPDNPDEPFQWEGSIARHSTEPAQDSWVPTEPSPEVSSAELIARTEDTVSQPPVCGESGASHLEILDHQVPMRIAGDDASRTGEREQEQKPLSTDGFEQPEIEAANHHA